MKRTTRRRVWWGLGRSGIGVLTTLSLMTAWPPAVSAAPFVYVTNAADGTVSVIDTATDTVTATVPVGEIPFLAIDPLAVSSDGTRAYVSGSREVAVIDTASDVYPIARIAGGAYDVLVDPTGTRLYTLGGTTISVIDTDTNTITGTVSLGSAAQLSAFALTPDGSRLYVTDNYLSTISVIDTGTNNVLTTITARSGPAGIAIGPDIVGPSPTPVPTATPAAGACPGDCNDDQLVTVDEILRCINIALDPAQLTDCPTCDAESDGTVTVDEIMRAVNFALNGCPAAPTATATPCDIGTPCPAGQSKLCAPRPEAWPDCSCEGPTSTPTPSVSSPSPTMTATPCDVGTPCPAGQGKLCAPRPEGCPDCSCEGPTPTSTPIAPSPSPGSPPAFE